MSENTKIIDRRSFLKKICNLSSLIGLCIMAGVYLIFAFPRRMRKKKDLYVYACDAAELPVAGVRQYYIDYPLRGKTVTKKFFIVNTGKELIVFSSGCTHLGCLINWHRTENKFMCPCHGGQYDMQGNVVAGPPPAPLTRLPLKIEGEKVYIGLRV
jgi:cytochrome b6-f complex iron-sulfur subunit